MKKFNEEFLRPFLFPIFLAFLTVFFREAVDFKPIIEFFGGSSNKAISFFNTQLYLWQIILFTLIIYLLTKIYSLIFKSKSKDERIKLKAINRAPKDHIANFNNGYSFYIKYKLSVQDKDYHFDSFIPYCNTNHDAPVRMSTYALGDYKCNCQIVLEYSQIKDIKSRIITTVENFE